MHRPAPLAENSVAMRLSRLLEVQVGAGQCRSIPDPLHPSNSDLILRPSTTMPVFVFFRSKSLWARAP